MHRPPPVHEKEFLNLTGNHGQLCAKLRALSTPDQTIHEYAQHVATCWYELAGEHLREAAASLKAGSTRAAFSRSYYAAYNASKAVRYMVNGVVSLKGDDHRQASELPTDFPSAAMRGTEMTRLYENRLRADYDNWVTTTSEYTLTAQDALSLATDFVQEVRTYLNAKYGMTL